MNRHCECNHPDCTICKVRNDYKVEIAKLREQLEEAIKDRDYNEYLADNRLERAEAAEAKLKAASEQEPDIYVHNDGVEVWGAAANPELAANSSYSPYWSKPVPADVHELQKKYDKAERELIAKDMLIDALCDHAEEHAAHIRELERKLAEYVAAHQLQSEAIDKAREEGRLSAVPREINSAPSESTLEEAQAFVRGFNACRDAMLAAAPTPGEK